jgi:hypothetical protein
MRAYIPASTHSGWLEVNIVKRGPKVTTYRYISSKHANTSIKADHTILSSMVRDVEPKRVDRSHLTDGWGFAKGDAA